MQHESSSFSFFRVQCLSNLAQIQHGGSMNSQLAGLAKARREAKRDSTLVKQESTEQLLMEKDEEIKRMQAMIQQMQNQLQASGAPSLNSTDSTMI